MTEQEFMLDSETTITNFKLEDKNLVYIRRYPEEEDINIYELYQMSGTFIEQPNTDVIFECNSGEILISKKTTLGEVIKQYNQIKESQKFLESLENGYELEKVVFSLNKENAKEKLETIKDIIINSNGNVPQYQLNYLSDSLLRFYRSTLPDTYFDSKIEATKKFIKEK